MRDLTIVFLGALIALAMSSCGSKVEGRYDGNMRIDTQGRSYDDSVTLDFQDSNSDWVTGDFFSRSSSLSGQLDGRNDENELKDTDLRLNLGPGFVLPCNSSFAGRLSANNDQIRGELVPRDQAQQGCQGARIVLELTKNKSK